MVRKLVVGFGAVGMVLLTAGCLGFYDDVPPPQQIAEPEAFDQPEMLQQRAYRPIPRPKPRPALAARNAPSAGKDAGGKKLAKAEMPESETVSKPLSNAIGEKPPEVKALAKTPDAGAVSNTETLAAKAPGSGPVTPAEIRTAVPVQKLDNPKQALFGVEIKSVWGGVLGRVASLDVAAGKLKTLDIRLAASPGAKPKIVRVEPSRLKFVPNRKMVLTTLSKPDLDRLPATANP